MNSIGDKIPKTGRIGRFVKILDKEVSRDLMLKILTYCRMTNDYSMLNDLDSILGMLEPRIWQFERPVFPNTPTQEDVNGDIKLALAAYNAGGSKVRHYQGVPPFKATHHYIKEVFKHYGSYKQQNSTGSFNLKSFKEA